MFNKLRGVPYIEPNAWLIRRKVSTTTNALNSLAMGVLSGGVYTAMQALDKATGGDGGFKEYTYSYTSNVNHYKDVLRAHMGSNFERESGGYPLGIKSLHDFRVHKVTSEKARKTLVGKGLKLPSNWTLNQRSVFDRAVKAKVVEEANKKWNSEVAKQGLRIPPNQSWLSFQKNPSIQARIKQEMGDFYVSPTLADWNNVQFKQHVLEVNVQRKTREFIGILKAQQKEFGDGGSLEHEGKQALRATIIPPISMSLSLFLVILTVVKLPGKTVALLQVSGVMKKGAGNHKLAHAAALKVAPLLIIFVLPVMLWDNKYTDEKSAVNYFLDKVDEESSFLTSHALHWLLTTQPMMQPMGEGVDNGLGITRAFKVIEPAIASFDKRFGGEEVKPVKTRAIPGLYPLTIKTNVPNAKIMIMNIKPSYKPGIQLPPGQYIIRVVAPDGRAVRATVKLTEKQRVFRINL
ncbi:hypothetical protein [Parendozoicomonas haliclonae]|uniref:Uncharacterized protein n=1 Tax=Parendozoicomonas haliclonae TaxID=1960125 RepID=A0A1X7ARU3_9GAMM|nr:hypothetical protein [Parendozoicomonas haliclonae]SMA50809.1 hypothetical protein EHSB41UT_04626 [Parendozoicomonas haliclonae]